MSTALRIAHGAFGRVALLDMDWSLVRHAHPHCHVLLKVEGADTQFVVGDTGLSAHERDRRAGERLAAAFLCPRSEEAAHRHSRALYRTGMVDGVPAGLGCQRRARLLQPSLRRNVATHSQPRHESGGRHDGPSRSAKRARVGTVRPDDRGDRALYAVAKFPGFDQGDECPLRRLAHPPRRRVDAGRNQARRRP